MHMFTLQNLWSLLHDLLAFSKDELDVTGVGHVRIDTAVCTVSPPPLLWCLVHLDMLDDQIAGVETLGIGIRFSILEKAEQKFGRLDGPACLADTELFALGSTASAPGISPHRYSLMVLFHILEVADSAAELPPVDGLCSLARILEGDAEIGTTGAGRLGRFDGGGSVAYLW